MGIITGSSVMRQTKGGGHAGGFSLSEMAQSQLNSFAHIYASSSAWSCVSGASAISLWNGKNWATDGAPDNGYVRLRASPLFDDVHNPGANLYVPLVIVMPIPLNMETEEGYEPQTIWVGDKGHGYEINVIWWDAQVTRAKVNGILFNVLVIGRRSSYGLSGEVVAGQGTGFAYDSGSGLADQPAPAYSEYIAALRGAGV